MNDHFYGVIEAGSGKLGPTTWAAYGPTTTTGPAPVVLIHGLSDSSACWPGVVEHLAETRLVIVVDLRGHGNADLPDSPLNIQALADDIAQIVRKVAQRPAVLIGHSLGAVVALDFALRAYALTAALVLEDPALALCSGPQATAQFSAAITGALEHAQSNSYVALITQGRAQNPDWPDDEFAPWAQAKKQFNPQLGKVPHHLVETDWVQQLGDVAPERDFPVLIIAGDPSRGSHFSVGEGGRAAELLADRGHIVRLDAGHCVRRDQRTQFLELLDEHLPN